MLSLKSAFWYTMEPELSCNDLTFIEGENIS